MMWHFLKKFFSFKDGDHKVLIIYNDKSRSSISHRLHPLLLWFFIIGSAIGLIALVILLIRFTPIGGLVYPQRNMRNRVIAIQHRVAAMSDTVRARNEQLRQMKKVVASGKDTNLAAGSAAGKNGLYPGSAKTPPPAPILTPKNPVALLPANAKLITNLFKHAPTFPAPYPISGAKTRRFNIKSGHYGLDIAASAGRVFKAIAAGIIVSEEWTFNYGYMIIVQHPGGIISIYKHAETLAKSTGETVRQGDILGTIGKVGILSSGPHLHIEIWKKGIPQNPENYLVKLSANG